MVKSITNSTSFDNKTVTNNNKLIYSDIKAGQIIATNATITTATITNLNNSQVSTNQANITQNASDIATLQTTTATNQANITQNASDITTLQTTTATNQANITQNSSDIATNQANITNKQDIITSSTSLSCADINCNNNSLSGVNSLQCKSLEIHNSSNNLSFLDFGQDDFRFRQIYNQNNNNMQFQLKDSNGLNNIKILQLNYDSVGVHNVPLDLNSQDLNNGGSGAFSSISLNSNDLQGLIDDKADAFNINSNGLILDSGAFPLPELRLLYNNTYFDINAQNELNLNGVLPTLTSNLNLGNNNITNGGDITADDITSDNINNNVNISTSSLQTTTINPPADYPTNAILRNCSFNTSSTNSTSSGSYGSNSYLNGFVSSTGDYQIIIGNNAITKTNNGIFTINAAGTYKITVSVTGDNVGVNDRVVLGFYLSLNTTNGNWQTYGDSFGTMYLRDDNFGQSGNCSFSSVRTYSESDNIRIKTKCGQGNNTWNETRDDGDIDVWANITFEKLF